MSALVFRVESLFGAACASRALGVAFACLLVACGNSAKLSADRAVEHVTFLLPVTARDVSEVRSGLPDGAKYLAGIVGSGAEAAKDPESTKDALDRARGKVQNLRNAKSTFFLLADKDGSVIRSDQPQDLLAGKNLFSVFPSLKAATGAYSEAQGIWHEARGVEGKPDGQWVAAAPLRASADAEGSGVYVTGWAWSLYARRLEEALKSQIQDQDKQAKQPLFYVFIVVGDNVYGTRPSPEVNAHAIAERKPEANLGANGLFRAELEITGRWFGLAAKAAPELGPHVLIAVLRSET